MCPRNDTEYATILNIGDLNVGHLLKTFKILIVIKRT